MSSQGFTADLHATLSLFAMLPEGAREEARQELHEIAVQAEAVQEQLVPRKSGFLAQGLTIEEALNALRARIGYPQIGGTKNKRFYAIIMEYGRKAQTVQVIRGTTANLNMARAGYSRTASIRKRLKAGLAIRDSYALHVTSLDPRPFIHVEDRIDDLVDSVTARFWDKALAYAGASQG